MCENHLLRLPQPHPFLGQSPWGGSRTMELHFRQFQASDSAALSQIIRETWRYDTFCPPSTASRLAKAYLYGCLAHQTYTQVALIHDVPVGIIMVNDQRKRRSPLLSGSSKIFDPFPAMFSKRPGRFPASLGGRKSGSGAAALLLPL